jgi:hypothetical protein
MKCVSNRFILSISIFAVMAVSENAPAELLFSEGFNYSLTNTNWPPAGTALGSVSAWLVAEPQPDSFAIIDGLAYPDKASAGGATGRTPNMPGVEQFTSAHQNVPALESVFTNAGTFYVTLLIRERVSMAIGDQSFNGNQQRDGIFTSITAQFETPGGGASNYLATLSVQDTSGEVQDVNDTGILLGETNAHMLAVRVDNDGTPADDVVSMVLDPDLSLGEPNFAGSAWRIANQNITTTNIEIFLIKSAGGDLNGKAWDEIRVATTWEEAAARLTAEIQDVSITNVTALAFQSVSDINYRLEYTTNLPAQIWTDAGFVIIGNGDALNAYDPTGFSTSKTYRILAGSAP